MWLVFMFSLMPLHMAMPSISGIMMSLTIIFGVYLNAKIRPSFPLLACNILYVSCNSLAIYSRMSALSSTTNRIGNALSGSASSAISFTTVTTFSSLCNASG